MNINAAPGTRVVFAHPNAGYNVERNTAAKHLRVGETYTVDRTDVGGWHTDVYLVEVPGVAFNSAQFADVLQSLCEESGAAPLAERHTTRGRGARLLPRREAQAPPAPSVADAPVRSRPQS